MGPGAFLRLSNHFSRTGCSCHTGIGRLQKALSWGARLFRLLLLWAHPLLSRPKWLLQTPPSRLFLLSLGQRALLGAPFPGESWESRAGGVGTDANGWRGWVLGVLSPYHREASGFIRV